MNRPNGLTGVTLILCVFNATGFLSVGDMATKSQAAANGMVFGILFAYFVLFFFWEGNNWARVLVLIDSILSLFMPLLLGKASPLEGAVIVSRFMMAVFLLIWLNTSDVRNYFKMRV